MKATPASPRANPRAESTGSADDSVVAHRLSRVFSIGQVAAVRAAFVLAGFHGEIVTMPVGSEDERIFIVPQDDVIRMGGDVIELEQVLTQLLGRKVWVLASIDGPTVPFA
jgi:hypothetical protein